jgi:DNA invertase Pin-like site-specific DNA recombinase
MRQPAIPKLSGLSTAGRAELLAIWTATLGKPPAALRTSRELLASAAFAQFEREVTGERIRDKIAAAKKKGLWMGGAANRL